MDRHDYWRECIAIASDECGLVLTEDQLKYLAESVAGGHEHIGSAFGEPSGSDCLAVIEKEYKEKLWKQQQEADRALQRYQSSMDEKGVAIRRLEYLLWEARDQNGAGGAS